MHLSNNKKEAEVWHSIKSLSGEKLNPLRNIRNEGVYSANLSGTSSGSIPNLAVASENRPLSTSSSSTSHLLQSRERINDIGSEWPRSNGGR